MERRADPAKLSRASNDKMNNSELPVRQSALLNPRLLGRWIAERHIWQMDFLNAKEMAQFSSDRGVSLSESNVEQLWQLGLIKADLVLSSKKLRRLGMSHLVNESNARRVYSDERKPRLRLSHLKPMKPLPSTMQPSVNCWRHSRP